MNASTKSRYRVPTHTEYVTVSLDEFSDEEIVAYMSERGLETALDGQFVLSEDELGRLETLVLCGQKESARAWLLDIVGKHIGRSLT